MLSGPLGVRVCLQAAADLDASWHDLSKFVKVRPAQICQAATCEIWHRMVPCAHQSTEHAYLPLHNIQSLPIEILVLCVRGCRASAARARCMSSAAPAANM